MDHRNDPVPVYCLALIAEDAGKAATAASQALRFGLASYSGPSVDEPPYKTILEQELGRLFAAAHFAAVHGLVDYSEILRRADSAMAGLLNPDATDAMDRRFAPPIPAEVEASRA